MSDCIDTVTDFGNVQEAVCVSVRKIMDACRDQDCSENVPVYLTTDSQETLENATSVKARTAELLYTSVAVEPVPYQSGYYCLDIQYYYRVIADVMTGGVRPATIYGLATTCTQAMLYGGEGAARSFSSNGDAPVTQPIGIVEAVDPGILCARIRESEEGGAVGSVSGQGGCCGGRSRSCPPGVLPEVVAAAFDSELVLEITGRSLEVTLGQFSLVRLERDTQLLIPSYDYCVPSRECSAGDCGCTEDPCETFSKMSFPVSAFFPMETDRELCRETPGEGTAPEENES